jgi:hypothetical protein
MTHHSVIACFEWVPAQPGRPFERACRLSQNQRHCNVLQKNNSSLGIWKPKEQYRLHLEGKISQMTSYPGIERKFRWEVSIEDRLSELLTFESTGTAMLPLNSENKVGSVGRNQRSSTRPT